MLHPDRNPNDPNALSRFLLIKNAFTDLELKLSPSAAKARHRNMRSYETTEEKLKRKYQSKRKEAKQTGEGFNFQEAQFFTREHQLWLQRMKHQYNIVSLDFPVSRMNVDRHGIKLLTKEGATGFDRAKFPLPLLAFIYIIPAFLIGLYMRQDEEEQYRTLLRQAHSKIKTRDKAPEGLSRAMKGTTEVAPIIYEKDERTTADSHFMESNYYKQLVVQKEEAQHKKQQVQHALLARPAQKFSIHEAMMKQATQDRSRQEK